MTHKEIFDGLRTDLSRKLFTRAVKAGYKFRNRCFYGAFKRGYVCCRDGLSRNICPYVDPPHVVTFRKGMARWWRLGYDFGRWTARPDIHPKPDQPLPKTKKKPIKPAAAGRTFKRGPR
jgi:ribosome modulation factor